MVGSIELSSQVLLLLGYYVTFNSQSNQPSLYKFEASQKHQHSADSAIVIIVRMIIMLLTTGTLQ